MAVIKADALGFCKGGRDSIEGVRQLLKSKEPVYVYGYLLHNEKVISGLKKLGVEFLEPNPDIKVKGRLVIRAHGISADLMKKLSEHNRIVDYTCPQVYKIHALANMYERRGHHIVYFGKKGHPEAEGTLGNLSSYTLVGSLEDVKKIKHNKLVLIAQSTCSVSEFERIAAHLRKHNPDAIIEDTICESTRQRQANAKKLAKEVDLMVVIGGSDSSNTRELYEICKAFAPTIWVQNPRDISHYSDLIKHSKMIGVSAGASTPDEDIDGLYKRLCKLNQKV
jgi:4-hydroxy-3-methylbut-2-enyl diphosphate reductase